jgi:hypothetical protein
MPVKHVLEALLDSDLFGEPTKDSRARVILLQRADHCVRSLLKLGMSEEGALSAINKCLERDSLSCCESPSTT